MTSEAAEAILDQAQYYEAESGALLARRWYLAIDDAIRHLIQFSGIGVRCTFRRATLDHVRRIVVPKFPNHLLLYPFVEGENTLTILMVVHGARHPETFLRMAQ